MPAASISPTSSCWPWSTSRGSSPVWTRPELSTVRPASTSRRLSQLSTFGAIAARDGDSFAAASNCCKALGWGALSSCSNQTQCVTGSLMPGGSGTPANASNPERIAAANEASRGSPMTAGAPSASVRVATDSSALAVSTATTRSAERLCARNAAKVSGNQRMPSWLTSTAVTR